MASRLPWPALVLTAGLGIRFRPLSYVRAKPAAPVAGTPLVRRILTWLAAAGVSEAVLNLHHRPESVIAAVGDWSDLGLQVQYSWEREQVLGSAGGPRKALPLLAAPRFLLVNGDTLCQVDLAAMVRQHETRGALVTMALVPNPDPAHYGGVVVDGDGCVRAFSRPGASSESQALHFVGVQVVEASVFGDLPLERPVETVKEVYPPLIERHRSSVQAFLANAAFRDVGTPGDYLDTSLAVARSEGLDDLPRGGGTSVAPTSRVIRSALWDDVAVDDDCEVVDSVVADGVHLPAGTRLRGYAVVRAEGRQPGPGEILRGELLVADILTAKDRVHDP